MQLSFSLLVWLGLWAHTVLIKGTTLSTSHDSSGTVRGDFRSVTRQVTLTPDSTQTTTHKFTAAPKSTCSVFVKNDRSIFISPKYQVDGRDTGMTFVTFTVSADRTMTSIPCSLSSDTIVQQLSFIHGVVQLYVILECSSPSLVSITQGEQPLVRQETTLLFLNIRRCVLGVEDVAVFSQIARLDTILVQDTMLLVNARPDQNPTPGFSQLRSLVFVFSLWRIPIQSLQLNTTIFSNITKLGLQGVIVNELPDYISRNYPNLLSLTLISCSLEQPPSLTLDIPTPGVLPLGLSLTRTELVNNLQNGIFVSPSVIPRVLKLVNNRFRNLSTSRFGGIVHSIILNNNQIRQLGPSTFTDVKGLQSIHLAGNDLSSLPETIFEGLTNLIHIDLSQNILSMLPPKQFHGLTNLRLINLEANLLTSIHAETFSHLNNIASLNIGWNKLTVITTGTLPRSPHLTSLNLGKNSLQHITSDIFLTGSLRFIDLSYTGISFDKILDDLENITQEKLTFAPGNGPYSQEKPILRLRWNNIKSMPSIIQSGFNTDENQDRSLKLLKIMRHFCVDLTGNSINCNCDLGLVLAILELSQAELNPDEDEVHKLDWKKCYIGWTCSGPESLRGLRVSTLDHRHLYCNVNTSGCPGECNCRRDYHSNVTADCSGKHLEDFVTTLPVGTTQVHLQNNHIKRLAMPLPAEFDTVHTLILSNNSIEELPDYVVSNLPTLRVLHIDRNNLTRLPESLNNSRLSEVRLDGNPFPCDCKNKWIKQWLLRQKTVVKDWESVECETLNNTVQPIVSTEDADFGCPLHAADNSSQIITLTVVLSVLVCLVVLLSYFHKEVHACIFVYGRLPLCGKRMAPVRLFVVSSREDELWTNTTLVSAFRRYPVCQDILGIRDFKPGFTTKEIILTYLQKTQTTILVMSNSFFECDICTEVFSILYQNAGQEMDTNVIFITKEDPDKYLKVDPNDFDHVRKRCKEISTHACVFRPRVLHAALSTHNHHLTDESRHVTGAEALREGGDVCLGDLARPQYLYDVSVVYGDSDRGLVVQHLMPLLTDNGFRVGIPDRDLMPGTDHAENMESLLNTSRHLIYMLSESLVKDEWSSFVFKLATDLNISRGTNYLCVVLDDNLQEHSLDGDVLVYIQNHVCLQKTEDLGEALLTCLGVPLVDTTAGPPGQ